MANKTALAIALLLTANTAQASAAIGKFTSDAQKRLEKVKSAATWDAWGNSNIKAGALMAAPIVYATAQAAKLESKIADVAKVVDIELGTKEFTALSNSAMEAGKYLGQMPGDVAELMAELAAGGTAADKLDKMAITVGKIGVAFDVTAGEAGKAWMTIQNALNATEKDAAVIMDAMNAVTNKYGGKAKELMQFMAEGGASVAQTLNVSGVAMQAFGNAFQSVGISASESATTMERFQKAVLQNAEAAKIFNQAGGGAKGLVAILEAAKASGNATKWLMARNFGEYSSKIAQMANNMEGEKGLKAQLAYLDNPENVIGSAEREYANRARTTEQKFNQTKVAAYNNALKLGQALLPVANQLMVAVTPIIEKISVWITKNPELTATLMKLALGFAAGRMALGGLQKSVGFGIELFRKFKTVLNVLSIGSGIVKRFFLAFRLANTLTKAATGVSMLGKAFSALRLLFVANPIGLAITAIAAAVFLVIKYWDKIVPFFKSLWEKVKVIFGKAIDGIKNVFTRLWDDIKAKFNSFVDWISSSWVGRLVSKIGSVGRALGFGNATSSGQPTTSATPNPRSASNTLTFSPTINLSGAATERDGQMIASITQKQFEQMMARYFANKERVAIA